MASRLYGNVYIYMLIIGITGQPSSGKDTIAEYLVAQGFVTLSTGDFIRAEMQKLGLPLDRAHMHDFVNKMRVLRGPGYLAIEAVKTIAGDTAVSGLRNVTEVSTLKQAFGKQFVLLSAEAPIEVRFKRAQGRSREGDHVSFEQFKVQEESERHGTPETQQVDDVIALADYVIKNEGTKEELVHKVDDLLSELRKRII